MTDPRPSSPNDLSFHPQDSGVASGSVVPSLMQVYNTMVQSKTPQVGPHRPLTATTALRATTATTVMLANTAAAAAQGAPSNSAAWNAFSAAPAWETSSLPAVPPIPSIPPIPPIPSQNNYHTGGYSLAQQPPLQDFHWATTGEVTTASGTGDGLSHTAVAFTENRSLRKRPAPIEAGERQHNSPTPSVASSTGTSRQGPAKARRKAAKDTDGRWSKRFSWPDDLHRDFVAAIFDVGLKHASPATILEHMPPHEQITSERVKSHLQKYRLHRIKSKKDFLASYDACLTNIQQEGGSSGVRSMSGGDVAAYVMHSALHEKDFSAMPPTNKPAALRGPATVEREEQNADHPQKANLQDILTLPRLTEAEKQSPLGASIGYLMGLFFSLKQQVMAQRAAQAAAQSVIPPTAIDSEAGSSTIFDSFVAGPAPPVDAFPLTTGGAPSTSTATAGPAAASGASLVVSNPSTRSNLEENNMMKREMQNQMAFQNKMRGLKQQELNKFRNFEGDKSTEYKTPVAVTFDPSNTVTADALQQGAGETDGDVDDRRPRNFSIGLADDFWNTDVVDDQLFEFLMSEG
jgi:SHAQKYF class myb-like DNA-binding protein